MSQDIINEVYFLAYSVAMGIVITFVYDFILIARQMVKHNLFFCFAGRLSVLGGLRCGSFLYAV